MITIQLKKGDHIIIKKKDAIPVSIKIVDFLGSAIYGTERGTSWDVLIDLRTITGDRHENHSD